MDALELKRILSEAGRELGVSHFGWTEFARPAHFEIYREWLAGRSHGDMDYLERHAPLKEDPSLFSAARSAIVLAWPYRPHPAAAEDFPLRESRVASYARGRDYHHWLKDRLERVAEVLRGHFPGARFEVHTDSSPLPERDLAVRAGLGWIGRNTCVIHPKQGSFFLLGEILCEAPLPAAEFAPLPDFCGTCRRCVEACPTGALREDRTMDARRCISYLSIESRALPAAELREGWGDWLFGCDICQSVCPWNQKPFRPADDEAARVRPSADDAAIERELRWILTSSGKQLEKAFRGTALARAGSFGLKRNALVVAGNRGLHGLRAEITALRDHPRLGPLAAWALGPLG